MRQTHPLSCSLTAELQGGRAWSAAHEEPCPAVLIVAGQSAPRCVLGRVRLQACAREGIPRPGGFGCDQTAVMTTPMSDLFRGAIPQDFAFFEGFDLRELLRATAW